MNRGVLPTAGSFSKWSSMGRKLRLDAFSEDRPSWPVIGLGGFVALLVFGALARRWQASVGPVWATALAAVLVFIIYFAILVRLVGAPWRVAARLAPIYALGMAVAFALLSLVDF